MGIVINFPGSAERIQREFEAVLEKHLEISEPDVKECVTKRVASVLAKYSQIPSLSVSVTLPMGITEESIQPIIDSLQKEYTEKVSGFALSLLTQICILEARICRFEMEAIKRKQ